MEPDEAVEVMGRLRAASINDALEVESLPASETEGEELHARLVRHDADGVEVVDELRYWPFGGQPQARVVVNGNRVKGTDEVLAAAYRVFLRALQRALEPTG